MRIRVAIRDKVGQDFITEEIAFIEKISKEKIEFIAKMCAELIQETIMQRSQMPTGKLASNFIAEPILNGWGVGDIATLDKEVPYWNHIDKGSEGIGANWEHFLPKGYWLNGRWVASENGYAGIKPKSPIPAMNYIPITLQRLDVVIPSFLEI